MISFLITAVVLVAVFFLLRYLLDRAPIDAGIKVVLNWVLIAIVVIWLIKLLLGISGVRLF